MQAAYKALSKKRNNFSLQHNVLRKAVATDTAPHMATAPQVEHQKEAEFGITVEKWHKTI